MDCDGSNNSEERKIQVEEKLVILIKLLVNEWRFIIVLKWFIFWWNFAFLMIPCIIPENYVTYPDKQNVYIIEFVVSQDKNIFQCTLKGICF